MTRNCKRFFDGPFDKVENWRHPDVLIHLQNSFIFRHTRTDHFSVISLLVIFPFDKLVGLTSNLIRRWLQIFSTPAKFISWLIYVYQKLHITAFRYTCSGLRTLQMKLQKQLIAHKHYYLLSQLQVFFSTEFICGLCSL